MKRLFLVPALLAIAAACTPGAADDGTSASKAPAEVLPASDGAGTATVILTEKARERLGVRTVPVEIRRVRRTRTLGGEIVLPPGHALTVSAPFAGTVRRPADSSPQLGDAVERGQIVFELQPLLPDGEALTAADRVGTAAARANLEIARVDAEGGVASARARTAAANVSLARAEELVRGEAASLRTLDEARAEAELAAVELRAAERRIEVLSGIDLDAEPGDPPTIEVASPMDGRMIDLLVEDGQVVAAGAPLFQVARYDVLWLRLPLYTGDFDSIDAGQDVSVGPLSGAPGAAVVRASAVNAPPSADADASTVDLWYQLPNVDGAFRPGQRVGVTVSLRSDEQARVVPWASILIDVHGGAWVYEEIGERSYRRSRVELERVIDGVAVLARGPEAGTEVVVDASAELYGTEFGTGK